MGEFRVRSACLMILIAVLAISIPAQAQKKKKPAPKEPQDAIEVVGHIPMTSGTVTSFLTTQHYSSYYLYVEHEGGKEVTLIDISKADKPVVLAEVAYPVADRAASLFAVTGTAALITDQPVKPGSVPSNQTVRIMDFSDPQHPKVARQFDGVTSISRDDHRGLIFLANGEGIWILRQTYAEDPEARKEYEKYILYNR